MPNGSGPSVAEAVRVPLPTPFGEFVVHAFESLESPAGHVHLALVRGRLDGGAPVLARVHSECLTGDALGSLRCDCGVQLRTALRRIAAEGRGVLVYVGGHEGRGIGLVDKLRAYVEQDGGADTVDANVRLGLAVDGRDFTEAAGVLRALGVEAVRLLSNNPGKASALRAAGVHVVDVEPLPVAAHTRNAAYLRTKQARLGHVAPLGATVDPVPAAPVDATALLGPVAPRPRRPFVVLKYAQTLDGRIATCTGDSKWISGEAERALAHGLRAACDAVLVGVGTVLTDDPQLTVRMVPGASPLRVALDSTLRTPAEARILGGDAGTVVVTTPAAPAPRVDALRRAGAAVEVVPRGAHGVDLPAAMARLADRGVRTLLVEGGARVITSLLAHRLVDRLIVSVSPTIIGAGTEAVGDLGVARVTDGVPLRNRSACVVGDDVILAWDVAWPPAPEAVANGHGPAPGHDRTGTGPAAGPGTR